MKSESVTMSVLNFGTPFLTNSKSVVATLPDFVSTQPIDTRAKDSASIFKLPPQQASATIPLMPQLDQKQKLLYTPYTSFVNTRLRDHVAVGQNALWFRPVPVRMN